MRCIIFKFMEDYAICINEDNETIYIRRNDIPDDAKEDDIINISDLDIDRSIDAWK